MEKIPKCKPSHIPINLEILPKINLCIDKPEIHILNNAKCKLKCKHKSHKSKCKSCKCKSHKSKRKSCKCKSHKSKRKSCKCKSHKCKRKSHKCKRKSHKRKRKSCKCKRKSHKRKRKCRREFKHYSDYLDYDSCDDSLVVF